MLFKHIASMYINVFCLYLIANISVLSNSIVSFRSKTILKNMFDSRLAEQAQRQLEKGGKFEDLNQIARPTELIRSYNALYSQARIDALDALDSIREMSDAEDLKSKLLFSVVVVC
jgi:hypothetical protein